MLHPSCGERFVIYMARVRFPQNRSVPTEMLMTGVIATLYILSKKLARVLSLTLTLHHSLSPTLRRVKKRDPEHHKYDNAPVEVSLGAVVIVVLKLVYGLDGKKR